MIELTVKRALGLAAKRAGDKIALRCGHRHMTHRELDVASNRLGRVLLSKGLTRGQRVAVVLPNCMEYVAIAIACAKAGLTMVTLNYRFTTNEYAIQLQDCAAELLIYDAAYMESVVPAAQQAGVKYFWGRGFCAQDHESLELIMQSGDSNDLDNSVSEMDVFY